MRQGEPAFGHHLGKISKAELVSQIPAHAEHDDLLVKVPALEQSVHFRVRSSALSFDRFANDYAVSKQFAPEPSRGRVEAEHAGYRLVADTRLYICRRRSRHAAFLRPQNRRPSIDGWGVGRNRGGGSHRGSPCPVLSAELAISRIPTSCFARAVVPTRTEGARFASSLAGSHARPGFLGAGGFPFRDPEVQRDTRSR